MIDPEFLAMLACPACHADLELTDDSRLVCVQCRRSYPIRDGFPVLLLEEATLPEDSQHGDTETRRTDLEEDDEQSGLREEE